MPDVAQGLESANDAVDPNSDAGFAASLAQAVGSELPAEEAQRLSEGERSVEAGLEVEEPSEQQPRDDRGRYAPREPEPAAAAEETPPPADEQQPQEEQPEPSQDWERRYREQEGVIGRQGQELGDLRRELAEIRQAREQTPPAPVDLPILSDDDQARLDRFVATQGGAEAINWLAQNRPEWIEAGYESWRQQDETGQADAAYQRYITHLTAMEHAPPQQQPQQQQIHPLLAEMEMTRNLTSRLEGLKGTAPDWDTVAPHFYDAYTSAPREVQLMVLSDRDELANAGLYAVISDARVRAGAKLAERAAQEGETRRQEVVQTKRATGIATGSQRSPERQTPGAAAPDATPEERSEAVRVALHNALMGVETTDVQSGLTYG